MKRFKDSNGNIFVVINGKTYPLSKNGLDLQVFEADTNWSKNILIVRDEYAKYCPNLMEF